MYPGMCVLIDKFSELCNLRETTPGKKSNDEMETTNKTVLEFSHNNENTSNSNAVEDLTTFEEEGKHCINRCFTKITCEFVFCY